MHDWLQEHQSRLETAFTWAIDKLRTMAGNREAPHDQAVRDKPIPEGIVYLRNFGVRGSNKMQDGWGSQVYEVSKAPTDEGTVYTIARQGKGETRSPGSP